MRALRTLVSLVGLSLVAVALTVLVASGTWLYVAINLPNPIESQMDVEIMLRKNIESARQAAQGHKHHKEQVVVDWPRPDLKRLPKLLVDLMLLEEGCPGYLASPAEATPQWPKRVFYSLLDKGLPGEGQCELIFARALARKLDAKSTLEVGVAADRIHRFLSKEDLLAFNMESTEYTGGTVGPEAASLVLMDKKLSTLSLAEMVEFAIALPPDNFWDEINTCQNASLIKQTRDVVLRRAARGGLISLEQASMASAQPLRCTEVHKWK